MLEFKNIFFKKNILIYGLGTIEDSYEHLKKDVQVSDLWQKYITKNKK